MPALIDEIRYLFHKKNITKEHLINIVENKNHTDIPLVIAYIGICETMLGEYYFLPNKKLNSFLNGRNKIEDSISNDPNNGEIRYLRLMVQLNAPSILNYNQNIEEDFESFLIFIQYSNIESKWLKIFIRNILNSKKLKSDQVIRLIKFKEKIQ